MFITWHNARWMFHFVVRIQSLNAIIELNRFFVIMVTHFVLQFITIATKLRLQWNENCKYVKSQAILSGRIYFNNKLFRRYLLTSNEVRAISIELSFDKWKFQSQFSSSAFIFIAFEWWMNHWIAIWNGNKYSTI